MTTPKVRVVVLNYNGGDLTLTCLDSLRRLDWPADRLEVVLVDNASSDGIVERVRATHPEVRVISSDRNLGFAGGNNLGLRDLGDADYVALLNNDATVEPGWLAPLVDALEADPGLGAANSKIVFAPRFVDVELHAPSFRPGRGDPRELGVRVSGVRVDGQDRWRDAQLHPGWWGLEPGGPEEPTFQWSRGESHVRVPIGPVPPRSVELRVAAEAVKSVTFRSGDETTVAEVTDRPVWIKVALGDDAHDVINNVGSVLVNGDSGGDRGYLEVDEGQYDERAEIFAWCGCSVLFRPEYLRLVGVFDDRLFLYYEDFDLSWRGRSAGWRYLYVPESKVRHIHAATSEEGSALFHHYVERNRLVMLMKNAPLGRALEVAFRYVLATASYARRDVVSPLLRRHRPNTTLTKRRVRSFLGFLSLLPHALRERRRIRRRQVVADAELLAWSIER